MRGCDNAESPTKPPLQQATDEAAHTPRISHKLPGSTTIPSSTAPTAGISKAAGSGPGADEEPWNAVKEHAGECLMSIQPNPCR